VVLKLARGTARERKAAVLVARAEQAKADGPSRRKKNPGMTDAEATAEYRRTHWGKRGHARVSRSSAPDPRQGTLTKMGRLVSVVYETRKGKDRAPTEYEHAFAGRRPTLAYNAGGLIITGGDYTIRAGGIDG
jgi:hypothetical protein